MKKLLLFACIISYTYNLNAQCDSTLPFTENFNDQSSVDVCWDFVNNDTDIYEWSVVDSAIKSASWISGIGALNPDNWIISHPINLTSNSTVLISWDVRATAWNFDQENYSIYIATGNNIVDFTSSSTSFTENLTGTLGAWQNRSLNISSLSGQTIYVAFRHHDVTDQKEIDIDNLILSATLGIDDLKVNSFKHFYNSYNDVLTLKSSNAPLNNIQIFNILGQQVLNKNLSHTNELINLSSIVDGIYIAQIRIDNAIKTIKFLKQ